MCGRRPHAASKQDNKALSCSRRPKSIPAAAVIDLTLPDTTRTRNHLKKKPARDESVKAATGKNLLTYL